MKQTCSHTLIHFFLFAPDVVVLIHCTHRLIGCLVGALVDFSSRPCVRTMCTLEHTEEARGRHNASLPDGARCAVRDRAVERLFLYARSSTSRQLRAAGSPHGRRARSLARRPSRRRSRGVSRSRLHRRSLFSPRPGSAGSAPRVRLDVRCTRGAPGSVSRPRQQASYAVRLLSSDMCTHHVSLRTRSTAYAP